MLPLTLRDTYRASVALAWPTGQWASVTQTGPTMWQCLTHAADASGQVQERLTATGPVEELVVLTAITANRAYVRMHAPV